MSDSQKQSDANSLASTLSLSANAVYEAWDFACQSLNNLNGRSRQAEVIAHGLVVGGIKDLPNELINHSLETAAKAGTIGLLSACIGAAISAKTKWIANTAKVLGFGLGSTAVAETTFDLASKPKLQRALSAVWQSGDAKTIAASKTVAEMEVGPIGFNWGLALSASAFGAVAGRSAIAHSEMANRPAFPDLLNRPTLHCSEIKTSIKNFVPSATAEQIAMLDQFVAQTKALRDDVQLTRITLSRSGRTEPDLNVEFKVGPLKTSADMPYELEALAMEIGFRQQPPKVFTATWLEPFDDL